MTMFINDRLVLALDSVAAIYPKPGEPFADPACFLVILKNVHVAASGHHNNFHGPAKIEITRFERKAIVELMKGAVS